MSVQMLPDSPLTKEQIKDLLFKEKLAFFEERAKLLKDAPNAVKKNFFDMYISSLTVVQLDLIKNWGEHLAFHGCFELLKLSLQLNPDFKLDNKACDNAAKMGQLEIVELCGEHGCLDNIRTNASACVNAAEGGHLKIIQFLRRRGARGNKKSIWTKRVSFSAKMQGHKILW